MLNNDALPKVEVSIDCIHQSNFLNQQYADYLPKRVVNVLAPNEDIVISNQTVDQLEDIQSVTHIIFSSTIPIKYDILNELYTLTNDEVVVAMRYGDDMKALFNYPSQATDETQWRCEELQTRPKQIFDIALYRKVTSKVGVEHV